MQKAIKSSLSVKKLPKTGYPDIEVSQADRITYFEMKTSSVKEQSGFRYTNVDKIKAVTRHLLLDIPVTQENPRYWKIDNWALSDLSSLNVRLKTEFNASQTDLMNINARIIASS